MIKGTIQAINIGKAYKSYPARFSRLKEWLLKTSYYELKWVLRDINFTVSPGEAVGIIGLNGAGKSTLLKILTGIIQPTTGSIHITGRIAAMLELGIGFHPYFTGRQNIHMAGSLLDYSEQEMLQLMPDIEAFAEIGDALDDTLETYSSGMQARLAFSIATAKRPDILIIDEALSVGDAYFQEKSFERIRQFQKEGTTLLFVSHSESSILDICDRAILLDKGQIAKAGLPKEIIDYYNTSLINTQNHRSFSHSMPLKLNTDSISIEKILVQNKEHYPVECLSVGEIVTLCIKIRSHITVPYFILGYRIKNALGAMLYSTNTHLKKHPVHHLQPNEAIEYCFTFPANLGPGSYSVSVAFSTNESNIISDHEWIDLALVFTVINLGPHFAGNMWLEPKIKIDRKSIEAQTI